MCVCPSECLSLALRSDSIYIKCARVEKKWIPSVSGLIESNKLCTTRSEDVGRQKWILDLGGGRRDEH